jgi:micrococcal nuclease
MRTKTVQKRLLKLALGLLTIGLTYYFREPVQQAVQSAPQVAASDYTVISTVDGDTIKVKMGDKTETVRFIGMDTPETHDPRKAVQCFGQQAADKTKELLLNKQVRLESDPNDSDRDKYKRLLRYVYVGDELINAKLIHDGYAFAYTVFPFTKLDEFRQLESDARANNRGLWAGCTVNDSSKIKQTQSVQ